MSSLLIYTFFFFSDEDINYFNKEIIKSEENNVTSKVIDFIDHYQKLSSDLENNVLFENAINKNDISNEILMQRMDIREPLSTLRSLLEQKLGLKLSGCSFWLQDSQMV